MSEEKTPNDREHKYSFKIIIVGDTNTGKTTICNTLLNRPNKNIQYQPTIGIDLNILRTYIYDNISIKSQLWDTAGQETYRSIINSYYRNTCGSILTYSITSRQSFQNLHRWLTDINKFNCCYHDYKHPILLLGTRKDQESKRQVSTKEAFEFASLYENIIFREITSFEKHSGLEDGILEFIRKIYTLTDNSRLSELEKIPLAKPIHVVSDENIQIPTTERQQNACVLCKGVKFNDSTMEIDTIKLKVDNGCNESNESNERGSKFCGKCI